MTALNLQNPYFRKADPIEVGRLFEKIPPHAIEAERCFVAAMMLEPPIVPDALRIVRVADDFTCGKCRAVYREIVSVYRERGALDLVLLYQRMLDSGSITEIGGESKGQQFLADLAMEVPSAGHWRHYARLVRDKAWVRRLLRVAAHIIHDCYREPHEVEEISHRAMEALRVLHEAHSRTVEGKKEKAA